MVFVLSYRLITPLITNRKSNLKLGVCKMAAIVKANLVDVKCPLSIIICVVSKKSRVFA